MRRPDNPHSMEKKFDNLVDYYNKFCEEKRLDSRHGQVEYRVTMKVIKKFLSDMDGPKSGISILDDGAGTGRYAVPLAEEGYDVTAVELIRYNLGMLKKKESPVKALLGNAMDLKRLGIEDETFDVTLLFGPLYHLRSVEDKLKALLEAKRVTRKGGLIFAAYCMNEYSVITYAFKERHVLECESEGRITENFHTVAMDDDIFDYVRLEDIEELSEKAGLKRITIFSPDGPADYMRMELNRLSDEEFEEFVRYQEAVCTRRELLGAGSHVVDVLRK